MKTTLPMCVSVAYAGRDAFPGKEGGTWLGMSKTGKIGILLNIWRPIADEGSSHAEGRGIVSVCNTSGYLVSDYLSGDAGSATYLEDLSKRSNEYKEFLLIAMEIRLPFENIVLGSYNNLVASPPTFLQPGIYGMGNSLPQTPWHKVIYGRDKFTEIVARHRKVDSKELLLDELFDLLCDETKHFPDKQLERQAKGKSQTVIMGFSALHVKLPEVNCGTRTNTVILVDGRGHVDYIERTMEEPIDAYHPKWIARSSPASDEYALVLVNNRDEDYSRPTKVSHFWAEDSRHDIIGGRDAFPGKEGGTWIGMSKAGKIAILLNFLQPVGEEHSDATGRGHLVSDYLCSDVDSSTYLDAVSKRGTEYNQFHLIAMEIRPPFEKVVLGSYNNVETLPPTYLKQGIHGMGNSPSHTPWCKVVYGRDKFTEIVARHRKVDSRERLIEELLDLLGDETRHLPDPQLEKQGKGKPQSILDGVSALHVKVPEENYGTRTNTVILVDGRGQVEYVERTMEEPINAYNPKWILTRHQFTLAANK